MHNIQASGKKNTKICIIGINILPLVLQLYHVDMYSYIPLLLSAIWTDYMHTHIRYIVCYQEGEEWVTFQKIPYYINGFTFLLDQSLIVWRKNSWNPQRVSSVFTFSCLSVCMLATEHTFWPRNLIFGLSDP